MRPIVQSLVLVPFLYTLAQAQPSMDATTRSGIAAIGALVNTHASDKDLFAALEGAHPVAWINGRCMVGFLALATDAFGTEAPTDGSILLGARKGGIASFRLDARHLSLLHQLPGLTHVELAARVVPLLDKSRRSTGADSVHAGINLPTAFTGEGVLVGVQDWGFDYTHPVFRDAGMVDTRIRAAWDHYRQAGPSPAGFGYGTELSGQSALLAAGSDTNNIYSLSTHGTHVAGIAAGQAAGTNYGGIAPGAQLLFNTFLVDAAAVVDGFAWMQGIAQADGKRLVVNMSWGLHWIGTLDGTSLLSQVIDQMSAEGVVFVTSAGNNGDVDFHLQRTFPADTLLSRVRFYSYSAHPRMWGQSLHLWGEPGRSFSAGFSVADGNFQIIANSPWYHTAGQAPYVDSMLVVGADTIRFNLTADAAHPLNGRPHFRLRIRSTNTQRIIVLRLTAPEGTVHAWNVVELTNDVGNWGQAFQASAPGWVAGDRTHGIGEPACAQSAIAVAAHTAETFQASGTVTGGAIANFSSQGPTLDGRMKPDITGPGVNVASAVSWYTDASYSAVQTLGFEGRQYPFARFSGTSMSSPAVAGVVALLLEADPDLTPAEVKALLQATARTDAQTGPIPPEGSPRWGAGKVNAYRALVERLGLVGIEEGMGAAPLVRPNPTSNVLHVELPGPALVHFRVFDGMGRLVEEGRTSGPSMTLDTENWAPGVHLLFMEHEERTWTVRVVKH